MPLYQYKGIDSAGKKASGTVDAESEKAARAKLRKLRIFPTAVISEGGGTGMHLTRMSGKVRVTDIANMTRQLAVLLNASIPLIDTLAAAQDQVENPKIRKAMAEIKEKVSGGARLADCMQSYPDVFDNIFVYMVKAGEASGSLDVVFNRLAEFKEKQAELGAKIKGAMMYPVIMFTVAVAMIGFLFTNVVPKITKLFEKQKAALPLPTEIVMGMTAFVNDYWYVVLAGMALAWFALQSWKRTARGREKIDEWKLKMPIFGELNRKVAVARLARTLSTLLNSGVQLLAGLEIVKNVMDNVVLARVIDETIVAVKEGEPLVTPLKRSGKFPTLFLQMIMVGEKTGMLEQMLEKVANTFDTEVDHYIGDMMSMITPIMLVFMGLAIGFIVMAVLMPILEFANMS